LDLFQRQFSNTGVVVVAVSVDKNEQKYRNFLKRIPLSFETARDPSADVSAQYGTFQYPETYIIKDNRIVRKFAEGEDWSSDDITGYVKSLL
jgi:peroxiredoxin